MAPETFSYISYQDRDPPSPALPIRNLTALGQNAWYWEGAFGKYAQLIEALVEARIDGKLCGETALNAGHALSSPTGEVNAGFGKLIVPSEDIQPGCGRPGATVTFTIDGAAVGSMIWQPGLQEVQLDLSRAGVKLPPTGSVGRRTDSVTTILMALATALAALGAGAVALSLPKVTLPHRR
jgi:hypothetical protein